MLAIARKRRKTAGRTCSGSATAFAKERAIEISGIMLAAFLEILL
jgi:hypothetical protein